MRGHILLAAAVPLLVGTHDARRYASTLERVLPTMVSGVFADSIRFTGSPVTSITTVGNYTYTFCSFGNVNDRWLHLYFNSTQVAQTRAPWSDNCVGSTVSVDAYTGNFVMTGKMFGPDNTTLITTTSLSVTVSIFQAGIWGPANIHEGDTPEYDALIMKTGNSVGPYTYAWSGILSGTGSSVVGSPSSSGYLYLTITDSNGLQSSVYEYVYVCPVGENVC